MVVVCGLQVSLLDLALLEIAWLKIAWLMIALLEVALLEVATVPCLRLIVVLQDAATWFGGKV